jgi:hypothetical protein
VSQDIISKKTRNEFREYFVGTTFREIEAEFDNADVEIDENHKPNCSGQRRELVEKYYRSIDWKDWRDVRKILTVYENVLTELENRFDQEPDFFVPDVSDRAKVNFKSLTKWLEKDGFKYSNSKLALSEKGADISELESAVYKLDIPHLKQQIERIRLSVEDDPSLAIGTAKELIETTCKTILAEYGIVVDDNIAVTKLIKETRKHLGLIPESIPNSAKGIESIQKILSNLGAIAQGLSELRNLYGSGHGKHGKSKGLSPRHARLAVGAASTLAMFLIETHEERGV